MRKKSYNIPRYSMEKAYAAFKDINLDMEKYNKETDALIKKDLNDKKTTDYDIIYATSSYVFNILEMEEKIPFPNIPISIESPLSIDTRHDIQEHLKHLIDPKLTATFTGYRASNYSVFFTLYQMYYDEYFHRTKNNFIEKVYYVFSFLNSRNISKKQKEVLDDCYNFMLKYLPYTPTKNKYLNEIIKNYYTEIHNKLLGKKEKDSYNAYIQATREYNVNYDLLYNILLDTTLKELTYHCIKKLYIECNTNTMTYKELIENYLFSDEHNSFPEDTEEAIYKKEEDSLRTHIKNYIFPNDQEEIYYRRFRGNSKIKNKTFSLCEQDIYNIIYVFYERRSPRQGKTGLPLFTQEDLENYYNGVYNLFIKEYCIEKKPEFDLEKLSKGYKLYLDYIILHKEKRLTANLIKNCYEIRQFHDIIEKALIKRNNSWYNMTSIFIAHWDFIQTAAYFYSERILTENHKEIGNSIIDCKDEFIKYCYELNKINLPETKQLLLSDKRFFDAYIEYPYWVQEMLSMLKYEYYIVMYTLSRFLNLKSSAFNNSENDLSILYNILSSYKYIKPEYSASDLQLETFLKDFLPSKKKK